MIRIILMLLLCSNYLLGHDFSVVSEVSSKSSKEIKVSHVLKLSNSNLTVPLGHTVKYLDYDGYLVGLDKNSVKLDHLAKNIHFLSWETLPQGMGLYTNKGYVVFVVNDGEVVELLRDIDYGVSRSGAGNYSRTEIDVSYADKMFSLNISTEHSRLESYQFVGSALLGSGDNETEHFIRVFNIARTIIFKHENNKLQFVSGKEIVEGKEGNVDQLDFIEEKEFVKNDGHYVRPLTKYQKANANPLGGGK